MKLIMENWRKFLKEDSPSLRHRKKLMDKPWWQNVRDLDFELLDNPLVSTGMADIGGLSKGAKIANTASMLAKGSRLGKVRRYTVGAEPTYIHFPNSFKSEITSNITATRLQDIPRQNWPFIDRLNLRLDEAGYFDKAGFTYLKKISVSPAGKQVPDYDLVFHHGGDSRTIKILKDTAAEYNIIINGLPL